MRHALVVLASLLLLAVGGWFILADAPAPEAAAIASAPPTRVAASPRSSRRSEPAAAATGPARPDAAPDRRASRAERDALRARILSALAAAEGDADDDAHDAGAPSRSRRSRAGAAEDPPAAGALVDRSGNHGYLLGVMNESLLPLADECYALARADDPELAGLLALDLELVGDEELGGVVDTITPSAQNEIADADLLECVRESILATTLPAPPEGGRDALMLSLRLTPGAAE